jgi:hypothetical protein
MAPLTMPDSSQLVGMLANIQGFEIGLLAISVPITNDFAAAYRPRTLRFVLKQAKHTIVLSWEDRHKHGNIEYTLRRPR